MRLFPKVRKELPAMLALLLLFLTGCENPIERIPVMVDSLAKVEIIEVKDEPEETLPAAREKGNRDNTPRILLPADAEETAEFVAYNLKMDTAHRSDGYIQVAYFGSNAKPLIRIRVPDGSVTYQYDLPGHGEYALYPMNYGSGIYAITVYEHLWEDAYTVLYETELEVEIENELNPFLYANPYCDFSANSDVVNTARDIAWSADTELDVIRGVFYYVTKNISYDFDKAAVVESGYVPDVDEVLRSKKGICLDYAALMTAMLRSQGIPSRMEIGYMDGIFHAWVSVYEPETGWLNEIISLGEEEWTMLDPTSVAAWGNNYDGMRQSHQYDVEYYY